MLQRYVCRGNKGCKRSETHKCGETCSDCKSVPPCMFSEEFRASPVTEALEVVRVSKNIRRTNWKAIRQSAKSFEIAPRVTYA